MPSHPVQDVSVGTVMSATLETLRQNPRPVLLFVGIFTLAGAVADYAAASGGPSAAMLGGLWQFVVGVASIVAMYLVLEAMLKTAGMMDPAAPRRFLAYFGQAIVIGLGVAFGLLLLVIPGLILAARWAVAQPLLVGRGRGVFAAMGESWELTRGHVMTIVIAAIALFALAIIAGILLTMALDAESLAGIVVAQLVSNGVSAASLAFTVALFGLIGPAGEDMRDIFA